MGAPKSRQIIRCFAEDFTATQTSKLLGIRRSTINSRYDHIRQAVFWSCLATDKEIRSGIIEVDESYFGAKRIKGKRGRGAGGKTKVLGLLKREGKVFVQIISDCSAKSLLPIIRGKVEKESIMNTDGWRAYDGLVDFGYEKYYRVLRHGKTKSKKSDSEAIAQIDKKLANDPPKAADVPLHEDEYNPATSTLYEQAEQT